MSTLRADTIQNTSGGAVTLTNQSAAKAWCAMTDAAVIDDSSNVSSAADNGVGDYQVNLVNSMNNTSYSGNGTSQHTAARHVHIDGRTASNYDVNQYFSTTQAYADGTGTSSLIHGDLA